jgi:hypothetical protein
VPPVAEPPDPRDMLAWLDWRVAEIRDQLQGGADTQDSGWLLAELAGVLVDRYEHRTQYAEILGEPDDTDLLEVLRCGAGVHAGEPPVPQILRAARPASSSRRRCATGDTSGSAVPPTTRLGYRGLRRWSKRWTR